MHVKDSEGSEPSREAWIQLQRLIHAWPKAQNPAPGSPLVADVAAMMSVGEDLAAIATPILVRTSVASADPENSDLFAARHLLGMGVYPDDIDAQIYGLKRSAKSLHEEYWIGKNERNRVSFRPFEPLKRAGQRHVIAAIIVKRKHRTAVSPREDRLHQPGHAMPPIALAVWQEVQRLATDPEVIGAIVEAATERRDQAQLASPSLIEGRQGVDLARQQSAALEHSETTTFPIPHRQSKTPRDAPVPSSHFAGRTDILRQLAAAECQVVGLWGMPGVGKSAILREWAHIHAGDFPRGVLFIAMNGFGAGDPITADEAGRRILIRLGLDADEVSDEADLRLAQLATELSSPGVLIMLDNVADVSQVESIIKHAGRARILITSRSYLRELRIDPGIHSVWVPPMAKQEARELLDRIIGKNRCAEYPDAIDRLLTSAAGLPLALTLVAAGLTEDPRPLDLILPAGSLLDVGGEDDPNRSVRSAFLWSFERLRAAEQRLLVRLSAAPQRVLHQDLGEILGDDLDASASALWRRGLLWRSGSHLTMHDLVREFASEQAVDPMPRQTTRNGQCLDVAQRCVDWQLNRLRGQTGRLSDTMYRVDQRGVAVAINEFESDWQAVLDCVAWSRKHSASRHWGLAYHIGKFSLVQGNWQSYFPIGASAYKEAKRLGSVRWRRRLGGQLKQMWIDALSYARRPEFEDSENTIRRIQALLAISPYDHYAWRPDPNRKARYIRSEFRPRDLYARIDERRSPASFTGHHHLDFRSPVLRRTSGAPGYPRERIGDMLLAGAYRCEMREKRLGESAVRTLETTSVDYYEDFLAIAEFGFPEAKWIERRVPGVQFMLSKLYGDTGMNEERAEYLLRAALDGYRRQGRWLLVFRIERAIAERDPNARS